MTNFELIELQAIKTRIEALEHQNGVYVAPWPGDQKQKKKEKEKNHPTIPQAEPAEVEAHPSHNWKPGNTGPQDE